jgi:hypothetical protein
MTRHLSLVPSVVVLIRSKLESRSGRRAFQEQLSCKASATLREAWLCHDKER